MSKQTIFTGAGVAIVTPMHADGSVNYERYRELIEWQIENGTDAIITCGTTGESSTLNHEEHIAVMRTAVEQAAGRVPVISGTGSNDTGYCIELSLEAQKLGADALLLVSPYYNKTSQRGLIAHYTAIADAVELPIILYNVPSRTGVDIKPETIAKLAEHPRIVAVKEANGNISAAAQVAALCDIDIYSGNDDQIVPLLSLGSKGVISVLSNILPQQTQSHSCQGSHESHGHGCGRLSSAAAGYGRSRPEQAGRRAEKIRSDEVKLIPDGESIRKGMFPL